MIVRYFVDTNVLVYSRDNADLVKQQLATDVLRHLWQSGEGRLSFQVLNEYFTVLTGKYGVSDEEALQDVYDLLAWKPCETGQVALDAAALVRKHYKLNWWDCLIVAAAISQNCTYLLSEDMADGVVYHNVQVVNPFKKEFQFA